MKYIGNQPGLEIVQSFADKWDYVQLANPTGSVNPSQPYTKWLNAATGEEFICTDNTPGANVWVSASSALAGLGSLAYKDHWVGTQAQYDALGTYDSNTLYFIVEA